MARKNISPAISFFSFQDIITSLTGIMFLIVLLLVILLAEMRPGTAVPDPALAELQTKIAENAAELQTLRSTSRQTGSLLKDLQKTDLDTVGLRCLQLRREIEKLQMPLRKIQSEISSRHAETANLRRRSQNLRKSIREQEKILKQRNTELQQLQSARKREGEILQRHCRTARIAVENRTALVPVLIECRKDGIRLLEIRSGKVTDLRNAGSGMEKQITALKNALRSRNREQEYYTLLVAPAAFEYAVLSGDDLGIREDRRGLEFYPDDRTTVLTEEEP